MFTIGIVIELLQSMQLSADSNITRVGVQTIGLPTLNIHSNVQAHYRSTLVRESSPWFYQMRNFSILSI